MVHASEARLIFAALIGAIFLQVGCQSTKQAPPLSVVPLYVEGDPTLLDTETVLQEKNSAFAKALAFYSQGLIHDAHGETGAAATNYVRAIEVDPSLDPLYLRASKHLIALNRNDAAIDLIQRLTSLRKDDATPHLWEAVIHQAFDRHDQAVNSYKAAIDRNPSSIEPYLEVVGILYRNEQYGDAIKLLERAIKQASPPDKAFRYLADLYQKRAAASHSPRESKRFRRKAIATLKHAIRQDIDDATIHWHLARLLIGEGDFTEGLQHYITVDRKSTDELALKEKLAKDLINCTGGAAEAIRKLDLYLQKHPKDPYAHFYKGYIHEQENEDHAAKIAYIESTRHAPPQSAAYWKAALLSIESDVSEARHLLEKGLVALPGNARIMEMLAFIYLQEKAYDQSVEQFERVDAILTARGISELAEKFHYNFALAAQGAGETDTAVHHLTLAIAQNIDLLSGFVLHVSRLASPNALKEGLRTLRHVSLVIEEPEVHYYIGVLSRYSKQYDAAISAFAYTEKMANGHIREEQILTSHFYFSFAAASEQANQIDQAETYFKRSIQLKPDYAEAHNYLAYMWSEHAIKLDQAMSHIQRALALEPENGAFLDTRGWIYFQQGHYVAALEDLKRAHELIPDDAIILEHIGDTYAKTERPKRAHYYWSLARDLDPDNSVLEEKLLEVLPHLND